MKAVAARRLALAAALALAGGGAKSHDTWFEPLPASAGVGAQLLALGTGNQFPVFEVGVGANFVVRQGCRRGAGAPQSMTPLRDDPAALVLRVPAGPPVPASCWVQLQALDIDLPKEKIGLYFDEAQPPTSVREAWAAIDRRGLPWKERYTKHARIELPGADATGPLATAPSGMEMDVLMSSARQPLRSGDELGFQVLQRGKPMPQFAVEFRNERARLGIWRRTDEQGRVRFTPTLPGQWVLRGIELRLFDAVPDSWLGNFVTLVFSVEAKVQ